MRGVVGDKNKMTSSGNVVGRIKRHNALFSKLYRTKNEERRLRRSSGIPL